MTARLGPENLDFEWPGWAGYRSILRRLLSGRSGSSFGVPGLPGCGELQRCLPPGTRSGADQPIRFVPASVTGEVSYEQHILDTGEVSTRENSWHDFFNALVWARFPQMKAALNAVHVRELHSYRGAGRGPVRDALTLFDESGAIVVISDTRLIDSLENRQWTEAFVERRKAWEGSARIFICGHALLEKFVCPYKSITAHVLLLHRRQKDLRQQRDVLLGNLDSQIARELVSGNLLRSTAELSPLPLMGIPGWWQDGVQDDTFYADANVFRQDRRINE